MTLYDLLVYLGCRSITTFLDTLRQRMESFARKIAGSIRR